MKNLIPAALCLLLLAGTSAAQTTVPAGKVAKHLGETVTVCAKVFGGKLIASSNAILLDVGGDHPNPELIVMIPGSDKRKFRGRPEVDYDGKDVTVTGKVVMYKGKPAIVVQNPGHLRLVLIDNDRILRPTPVNKQ
jgi:hypothetical protein